ncbi:MAG: UDP-3-O-(3-hydroxymyristoyl)glucosamine N-acyltransferase [Gammaproteobacteria bacterium]|nr:UDP-3-O-(3-hydroxymyristoyl)glucosamine N-acyltransferase [Gammaproteobacteria bacterium]
MITLTLGAIAAQLGAVLEGPADLEITGLATLEAATSGQLSFLANPKYKQQLKTTAASAVLVSPADRSHCPVAALVIDNPYLAYARLSLLFEQQPRPVGIHPTAVLGQDVVIGADVAIGPYAVVGDGVALGDGVTLDAHVVVGDDACIGARTRLYPQVTLYPRVVVGTDCRILSGAVVGADGFGYANERGKWVRIAQLGSVRIGDRVEIGANTTIDRGALDDTVIDSDVIIDNQVQIAHNVRIGQGTAIAGATVIAGSTTVGKYCVFGGACAVNGHIEIGDGQQFTGMSMVMKGFKEPGVYSSGVHAAPNREWRKNSARFAQLDELFRRVKQLEQQLADAGAQPSTDADSQGD